MRWLIGLLVVAILWITLSTCDSSGAALYVPKVTTKSRDVKFPTDEVVVAGPQLVSEVIADSGSSCNSQGSGSGKLVNRPRLFQGRLGSGQLFSRVRGFFSRFGSRVGSRGCSSCQ